MKSFSFLVVVAFIIAFALLISCTPTVEKLPISIDEAIGKVKDEVLSQIPEDVSYVCVRLDEPLEKGAVITEVLGDLAVSEKVSARLNLTLSKPAYFFFLDKDPYSYFLHETEYILVYDDGSIATYTAYSWPVINGNTPPQLTMDYREIKNYIIGSNFDFTPVQSASTVVQVPWPAPEKEGFIIVQGLLEGESCYSDAVGTYLNAINVFRAYVGDRDTLFDGLIHADARNVLNRIGDFVREGATVITIFIIAHGGVNTARRENRLSPPNSLGINSWNIQALDSI